MKTLKKSKEARGTGFSHTVLVNKVLNVRGFYICRLMHDACSMSAVKSLHLSNLKRLWQTWHC